MKQTGATNADRHSRDRKGKFRLNLLTALLLAAAAFAAAPARSADQTSRTSTVRPGSRTSYSSSSSAYRRKGMLPAKESGTVDDTALSSVSRPGESIYTRKGLAGSSRAGQKKTPGAGADTETDAQSETEAEETPAQTSSVSPPRSPLAAARAAAQADQPKVVDEHLLSELSMPAPRPSLSRGGTARPIPATPAAPEEISPPAEGYSYFDDSGYDGFGTEADTAPEEPSAAAESAASPSAEFPELDKYDLPDELPPESPQGFQSFAEEMTAEQTDTPNAGTGSDDPPGEPVPQEGDATGYGDFADVETFDSPAPAEDSAGFSAPAETANAEEAEPGEPEPDPARSAEPAGQTEPEDSPARYDGGFTVSEGGSDAGANGSEPDAAERTTAGDTGFADVETLGDPESAPPQEAEFPEFARNAYEALEPSEKELSDVIDRRRGKPERERESIAEKERAEEELKAEYDNWLAKQKADRKEKEKMPRYLQPLDDDRAVFESEDSPYARGKSGQSEEEHKFVREISAADLNLMSDVSSNRELMDWEKEQDMPVDWSKYSASALYNKWRDYIGMGPNEKEALAIMKKATLELMEYEKTKEPKKLREAAELYEKAGKKWPDSILEEDALFYAGECCFFGKNYTKAKTFYKGLLKKYSNSVLRRDAMERLYCIGVYWVKCAEEDPEVIGRVEGKERPLFSDFAGAKDAFETIFTNDVSDRGRAPDAVFALANAYMRRGVQQGDASFEEAAKYYQRLYEFYPACKYADKAYQLAMLALYQSYRGPFYDSTPLRRAEEIAKAAQRAHKGDRKVIEEQLRLIREKQAEYLLVRGEYYEKKKIYASARSYYSQLIGEYPESGYAAKAAERYTAIRENPAESDQFALIRPVAPFLPKSNNTYFEDRPDDRLSAAAADGAERGGDIARPDFTQLEKTAEAGRAEGEVR